MVYRALAKARDSLYQQQTWGGLTMSDVEVKQEKDYFWFYIGGLVLAVVVVLLLVKSSEHDKYATAAQAIAEDSTNASYKK